jgi:hypothetical protein
MSEPSEAMLAARDDYYTSWIGISTAFNDGFASAMPTLGSEIGTFFTNPFTAVNQMMSNAGGFLSTDQTVGQVLGWSAVVLALLFVGGMGVLGGAGTFKLAGMIL